MDTKGTHRYKQLLANDCTFGWGHSFSAVKDECHAARNVSCHGPTPLFLGGGGNSPVSLLHLRKGVAIFDQSYFGKFFLRGRQAKSVATPSCCCCCCCCCWETK
jgi:glycine cleavage system aminomethyltransferase T